jgi:poly(3-hydroxyalkanoate) synthetase
MHMTGTLYDMLATAMRLNAFTQTLAAPVADYASFLKEKAAPISDRPWLSDNEVVARWPRIILRKFKEGEKGHALLLVPPEAGHNSQIVDYGPEQSLVQCASDNFRGDVYVIDKLRAGLEHATYSIEDSIHSLDLCVRSIGEPVHLVGLCQGGWQSAIYAALYPERVKTLTLAGAPIDFHAGDGIISEWARMLPISFFQAMVAMGRGRMPGAFITTGFKMMNAFDRFIGDDMNLYDNINDPGYVERYRLFKQWYEFTQPIGGQMYLEVVEQLFKENKLVKGLLEVMGRKVDLSHIYHPLYLIAGTEDEITPPAQLFAMGKHVSSTVIEEKLAEAGHIGVFMKNPVIKEIWSDLFGRLSYDAFAPERTAYAFESRPHSEEELTVWK